METEQKNPTESYDFELPKDLIAQFPLPNREDARLMVVDRGTSSIEHFHVRDLPQLLRRGDMVVQNDSRVIKAKLKGRRDKTGGRWTGLFLEANEDGIWRLLAKTRGKVQPGETVTLFDRDARERCQLTLLARLEGGSWAAKPSMDRPAHELLEEIGAMPLPHYIRGGNMVDEDIDRYQTVYAANEGSIAAPTAGLHFTDSLIERLSQRGVGISRVTLHVGLGTFQPITADALEHHEMHSEYGHLDAATANRLNQTKQQGGRIIAVGTTAVRVLETAAAHSLNSEDATRTWGHASKEEEGTEQLRSIEPWSGSTDLFIRPGYHFKLVDGLLTNFHLPRSTLLVLARTFGGEALIKRAYEVAVQERYRFFSYGDAMLIL